MLFTLPSLINVGSLLLLVFFIYAILGVFLFKDVTEGEVITKYANFHNFTKALVTLFRCATGEDWGIFVFDLGNNGPDCVEGKTCGASLGTSITYFFTFVMICSWIMLNLFILIIIEYFENFNLKDNNPLEVFNDNIE